MKKVYSILIVFLISLVLISCGSKKRLETPKNLHAEKNVIIFDSVL